MLFRSISSTYSIYLFMYLPYELKYPMTDTNEINFNTIKIYFMEEIYKVKKHGFFLNIYIFFCS